MNRLQALGNKLINTLQSALLPGGMAALAGLIGTVANGTGPHR